MSTWPKLGQSESFTGIFVTGASRNEFFPLWANLRIWNWSFPSEVPNMWSPTRWSERMRLTFIANRESCVQVPASSPLSSLLTETVKSPFYLNCFERSFFFFFFLQMERGYGFIFKFSEANNIWASWEIVSRIVKILDLESNCLDLNPALTTLTLSSLLNLPKSRFPHL